MNRIGNVGEQMNKPVAGIAISIISLAGGCASHNNTASTMMIPPTSATDKKLIKTDKLAAATALSSDHQAILPTTGATTTPATDQIVSSLRIAIARIQPSLAAATRPADRGIEGTVTFTQVGSMLIVVAELSGVQPNSSNSLEIHQFGDLSAPDLLSAGNRWKLDGSDDTSIGLLGNVDADSTGRVYFERTLGGATVGGENSIVGHSVLICAGPDDARIAGGVIERHNQ